MTDIGRMLQDHARSTGTPLWVVEKDYALSYVLACIANTEGLGNQIVLKGGTALKKVYFSDYRFSEDLDYSTRPIGPLKDVDELMETAVKQVESRFQESGFVRVQIERLVLREPHPTGQAAYTIRIQFPYQRLPLCRVKVEITTDEQVLQPPEKRGILHEYPETFIETVEVYALSEILAEKLRALLQSLARVQSRGWGASRVCRDYYDIWQLLNRVDFSNANIAELTDQKCAAKGVNISDADRFLHPVLLEVATKEWDKMLAPFVSDSIEPGKIFAEIKQGLERFW